MVGGWTKSRTVLVGILLLGVALRCYHYFRDPAVWHDEGALIVNVLSLGYAELAGPLRHTQAAPPLFLLMEKLAVAVLGDGTLALRLPAFLASLPTLFLIAWAARRELGSWAAIPAVLLIAFSDRLLWHACEVKPYSTDVLCGAVTLGLFSATRGWTEIARLAVFVPLVPLMLFLSYPACFLCGSLLVALSPAVLRDRRLASMAAFAVLVAVVAGSFLLVYFGPVRAQRSGEMLAYWTGGYPDWGRPWAVPVWMFANTCEVLRYCFMPCGYLLFPFAFAGGVRLWKMGRGDLVVLASGPLVLNLMAGCLGIYPYGGTRLVVHTLPGLALLIATGAGPMAAWLGNRWRPAAAFAGTAFVLPVALTVYHLSVPWFRPDSAAAADYVLQRHGPSELFVANQPEFEYYCRRLAERFRVELAGRQLPPEPTWIVLTAYDPAVRAEQFRSAVGRRPVLERCEFAGISVALVGSDASGELASAPPSAPPGGR
jgi:hypothetical protein